MPYSSDQKYLFDHKKKEKRKILAACTLVFCYRNPSQTHITFNSFVEPINCAVLFAM